MKKVIKSIIESINYLSQKISTLTDGIAEIERNKSYLDEQMQTKLGEINEFKDILVEFQNALCVLQNAEGKSDE